MSRSSSSAPKYRLHKPSGQAVVTLSARDFYLGPYGAPRSRQLYDRIVGEWLANGRQLPRTAEAQITVCELAAEFCDFAREYYKKNGRPTASVDRIRVAVQLLVRRYGDKLVVDFGPLALRSLQNQWANRQLSRRYVNDLVGVLKQMFKWGVSQELVPASVHHALATVPGLRKGRSSARETAPVAPVSDAAVDATVPHLPPVVADIVLFQRFTGCRPDEACSVRLMDIDTTKNVWQYRPMSHKTEHHGQQRVVYIGPRAQAVLVKYGSRPVDAFCFSPIESEQRRSAARRDRRTTPLRRTGNRASKCSRARPPKQRYTVAAYRRAIQRACLRAGIPTWGPNQLRHSVGTEVRMEFGLEAAQAILGHARIQTTQVYAERNAQLGQQVAQAYG